MAQKRAIIPNSFTMTNLVFGFLAIVFASKGDPKSIALAGILVFAASFFDFFDGAAARALGVSSAIDIQLDSLADVVAYGIAPGFIAYQAFLSNLPGIGVGAELGINWGMIIAPIYPICATYRLAKFNIEGCEEEGFTGLPTPAAGILISSIPALGQSALPFVGDISFTFSLELFVPMYAAVAILMVSPVDYTKLFADIIKKGKTAMIMTAVCVILLLFYFNMWAVFVISLLYVVVGVLVYIKKSLKKSPAAPKTE